MVDVSDQVTPQVSAIANVALKGKRVVRGAAVSGPSRAQARDH